MSSPGPESVSLLQGCGDSTPSPSPSPTRDSADYFGEESARAELSLEPRSLPATALLEREIEQLKAQVAYWQQHCLDAEVEVKRLRTAFREWALSQRKLDRDLNRQLANLDERKESDESQELL